LAGHVARMGEKRGSYRVFVGRTEETRSLWIPRRRSMRNNKMYLQEVGCVGMGWINLAQGKDRWRALVNAVMRGISWLIEHRLAFQDGLCSMQFVC
jgi:hypothetical protein